MPWMKLDDKFHASDKLLSIPKRYRFQAAGLWAVAGSWVAGQETDGFVPDYMIQEWGPTKKTIECLVDSGLWERVRGGFAFNSWLEYNPSKEDTARKRAASKERMRATRERRKSESAGSEGDGENVALQQTCNTPRNVAHVLQRPDPTRPDPTLTGGTTSQPSFGSSARDEEAGGDPLDELAAATRRARQAGIPETAIAEGTRRYQAKPEPKGPGLLRTLIDEAAGDLQSQEQTEHARATRRAAITACPWCDERGMLDGHHPDGTAWSMKCTHPDDMPTPPQPPTKPEPQGVPDTAAQFLARLEARTTGGPF